MKTSVLYLFIIAIYLHSVPVQATSNSLQALDIIRRADDVRSPNEPFRYNVTVLEYKENGKVPENMQSLDISMRFIKPENGLKADARSLIRFTYPPRDKGKIMLSDWYYLWFYTPELRRPIPISRSQRLIGQISNGDVIVTNFEYAYDSTLEGEEPCGDKICYRLSLTRKSEAVTYPKVIYLVEKNAEYRPFKASYYSLDNQLLKSVLYKNYQMVLGKNRPTEIIVQNARYEKGYSVMKYSDVRLESLPEFHFTKEFIQRGAK
ncbi:TPA: outer membrane lipoprotein-sorting protein [Klebsiella aerogenes]|uniref:outer membrane lipoprotein-sorting protein n=1 Tax=Klebsiella aerogenes TaxID=548 RepID=UPI0037937DC0|nr:outer membrane lipoprotein-sorting protein [Klebsiella aerogenes]HBS5698285.1 outer membrane lipoprotein-sorting protein [Klebsiella aerogenes]